jgi:hypothetical protein
MAKRKPRRPGRPVGDRTKRIIDLYLAGRTAVEIAPAVGCSYTNVYLVLRRHKVWQRPSDRSMLSGGAMVLLKLHKAGLSQALLARLLGVSTVTLAMILRRQGRTGPAAASLKRPARAPQTGGALNAPSRRRARP